MSYKSIIRRFQMEGRSRNLKGIQQTYEHTLLDKMKVEGYAQLLDLEPYYEARYNRAEDEYNINFVLHGVYVGLDKAKDHKGMYMGKSIDEYQKSERPLPEDMI